MSTWEHAFIPFFIIYVLYQVPPTMQEILCYYSRGGLVRDEADKEDQTTRAFWSHRADLWVYAKRFLDRPTSEAAKAFFGFLDWSAVPYDRAVAIERCNFAKRDRDVPRYKIWIFGPFVFNRPSLKWYSGDDAAALGFPLWGTGGEARAREEYQIAKEKGFNRYWHYSIMKKIRRDQQARGTVLRELQRCYDAPPEGFLFGPQW